mmetsp:Transcript_12901/g.27941  ORF Transcript_12901/g.27941 Transcript_12901/m.27941 type:complete len:545 (-) Transcript_12901:34-1668(-)
MRAVQESVARSRQAALEKKNARLEQEALKRQAQERIDALRLQKERCLKAREDLMKEIDLAHEDEALGFLEEIRADPDMLISHDRYGSTLLHEACSRGMKHLALAVLSAAEEVGEATQERLTEKLFQRDYRGQTPLHRAAAAGSGEICTELCKQRFCRPGIRDLDGRTAWQVASFWGFDAAADSIFRALHYIPPLELRVEAPQDNLEPVQAQAKRKPSKQPKKGAKDKKQLQRPGSKEKPTSPSSRGSTPPGQAKRGSIASSQGKRGSVTSSQGKRGSLTSQGKRLSAASSQNLEGKPTTPSRASSKSKEKPGPQSASKDAADIAEELFPDAPSEQEQMPAEEAEAEDGAANPAAEDLEPGLTDEEEGPTRPPLPEDMGHRAGFQAVSDGRLEDAMVLASLPLWPFTNELNSRGWTLLHVAAHGGFEELCAALCHRKDFLCIDMPDKEFWATPLHLAAGKRRPECCNAIVQSGRCAKVNATDLNGQTPLHLAALRGDESSYMAIAAHPDCDPMLPDKHGRSPCEYAAARGLKVDCAVPGFDGIDL